MIKKFLVAVLISAFIPAVSFSQEFTKADSGWTSWYDGTFDNMAIWLSKKGYLSKSEMEKQESFRPFKAEDGVWEFRVPDKKTTGLLTKVLMT